MQKAYVLIEVAVGKSGDVASTLRGLDHIESVEEVAVSFLATGTYDIVAIVKVDDTTTVARMVPDNIRTVEGVVRTTTLHVVAEN